VTLCKHDWVGDDNCVYCRNEELEQQLASMKDAAAAFLNDLEERTSTMAHHPDEAIRDHYCNGTCLPVGSGVLFNLRRALESE